jgi:predicted nucleic acid-binding protein
MSKKEPKVTEFVLDCSVALAWCFPDEKAPYPQTVLDSLTSTRAVVPPLWPLEIANALLMGERRRRYTQADVVSWLEFLKSLPILVDEETLGRAWSDVVHLARTYTLSASDAAYLELALRRGLPLATLHDPLKKAATAAGVPEFRP